MSTKKPISKKQEPFKKPKIKVGKKLPKNENLTKINLKIRKVVVPDQVSQYEDHDSKTKIKMIFIKLRSTKDSSRTDALSDLYSLLRIDSSLCYFLIDYESSLIDFAKCFNEKGLKIGFEILSFYLKFQFDHNFIRSFFIQSLWSNMRMLFSYIDQNIRESSIKFFIKNSHIFASYYSSNEFNKYVFINEIISEFTACDFINVKEINTSNFSQFFNIISICLQSSNQTIDHNKSLKLEILSFFSTNNIQEKKQQIKKQIEHIIKPFLSHLYSIFTNSSDPSSIKTNFPFLLHSAMLTKHLLLISESKISEVDYTINTLLPETEIKPILHELDIRGYLSDKKSCTSHIDHHPSMDFTENNSKISLLFINFFSYLFEAQKTYLALNVKHTIISMIQSMTYIFDILLLYKQYFGGSIKITLFQLVSKYLKFICALPDEYLTSSYELIAQSFSNSLSYCINQESKISKLFLNTLKLLKIYPPACQDSSSTCIILRTLAHMIDNDLIPAKNLNSFKKNYINTCYNLYSKIDEENSSELGITLKSIINSNLIVE